MFSTQEIKLHVFRTPLLHPPLVATLDVRLTRLCPVGGCTCQALFRGEDNWGAGGDLVCPKTCDVIVKRTGVFAATVSGIYIYIFLHKMDI